MPLLDVKHLSVAFNASPQPSTVVGDISFTIEKGEVVALIGESGSGKSVTALSILQLLSHSAHTSGGILFDNQELNNAPEKQLQRIRGNRISMIFQEPMTSLNPLHTIERQISETLLLHKAMSKAAAKKRIIELLKLVQLDGLVDRLNAYPHELSGGQRQRVMIAMALACEPELLIADEPTTALDVTIQAGILKLLKDIQSSSQMALLFITHDLHIVRQIAHRVCVMQHGKIVEQGTVEQIFTAPQHPYTKQLLASAPKENRVPIEENAPEIFSVSNLSVALSRKSSLFGRKKTTSILSDISFSIKQGHTLGIVGESGSGKSTLALAALKLITSNGAIYFEGNAINALYGEALRHLRRKMQIVFQDPFASLNPRMTVEEILKEGLNAHQSSSSPKEKTALITQALTDVELDPAIMHRYPHEFSGGQRQRIAIARALILSPHLVILDEPTSALDVSVQAQIIDLLSRLQQERDLTLLFISHDLRIIRAISHHVIVMRGGKIVERGETTELFANPQMEYTKMLIESNAG
jgi:microcin C transport system ATP-binding protein